MDTVKPISGSVSKLKWSTASIDKGYDNLNTTNTEVIKVSATQLAWMKFDLDKSYIVKDVTILTIWDGANSWCKSTYPSCQSSTSGCEVVIKDEESGGERSCGVIYSRSGRTVADQTYVLECGEAKGDKLWIGHKTKSTYIFISEVWLHVYKMKSTPGILF